MSTLQVSIPDEVREKVTEAASRTHVTIDEFTTMALVDKLTLVLKDPYLEGRAKRGSWRKFREALAQVPDVPPDEEDRLE